MASACGDGLHLLGPSPRSINLRHVFRVSTFNAAVVAKFKTVLCSINQSIHNGIKSSFRLHKKMNFCCSFSPAFSEHFLVLFQCNYEQSPDPEARTAFLWYCCQRERRIHRPQAVGLQRYGRTVVPFPCQSF